MDLASDFGVSGNRVLRMIENLPKERHFRVYFDNLFGSVPLLEALKDEKSGLLQQSRQTRVVDVLLIVIAN